MITTNKDWLRDEKNHVRLFVKVKTHAAQNSIIGIIDDGICKRLEISVTKIPEKGKANKEIIVFLSKTLQIAKSHIDLTKGETLSLKEFSIYNHSYIEIRNKIESFL